MKNIAIYSLAALLLSSCTKELPLRLPIQKEISITMYYQRYKSSEIKTWKGLTFGYRWETTASSSSAPAAPDDGLYTLHEQPDEESESIGEMRINMHRNAPIYDTAKAGTADSLDLIGNGYWTLESSSGSYSYITKAAGIMTYKQAYTGDYEYPNTTYYLTGRSN